MVRMHGQCWSWMQAAGETAEKTWLSQSSALGEGGCCSLSRPSDDLKIAHGPRDGEAGRPLPGEHCCSATGFFGCTGFLQACFMRLPGCKARGLLAMRRR